MKLIERTQSRLVMSAEELAFVVGGSFDEVPEGCEITCVTIDGRECQVTEVVFAWVKKQKSEELSVIEPELEEPDAGA